VEEEVLLEVDGLAFLPGRHASQREMDDAVERRLDIVESEQFLIKIGDKARRRPGRALVDHQPTDVLRAGLRLGNKESEIEQGEFVHRDTFLSSCSMRRDENPQRRGCAGAIGSLRPTVSASRRSAAVRLRACCNHFDWQGYNIERPEL
jgi:hypothetical protein